MIPAISFMSTLYVNVDNDRLTDAAFRELVRNTIDIVDFPRPLTTCKFCEFEYDGVKNPCSEDCSSTSCPMCSSCQNNNAGDDRYTASAKERRRIKEGKLSPAAEAKKASFPSRYGATTASPWPGYPR
jgi:hypothetical protein